MAGEWGATPRQVQAAVDPSGWGDLVGQLRAITARLDALETRNPLQNASIGEGGLRIYGGGGLVIEAPGTANLSGDTTIGGNLAVTGTLSLPAGIIDNDALTSPVEVGQGNNGVVGFAVPGAEAEVVGFNFTVPAGYTRMICMTSGGVSLVNESVNFDYAYARIFIDTFFSDQLFAPATGNNGSCTVSAHKQGLLPGLTGGQVVRVSLRAATGGGWGANATNRATVVGMATFLR